MLGQIQVSNVGSVEKAVKELAGEGVIISNVTYKFDGGGQPIGTFNDDFGILGVDNGLLMTNGSATDASGPNDSDSKSTSNGGGFASLPELKISVFDLVVVEFDIQVSTNVLEFVYVFGSEEYPEFADSYHDAFGFFITGPGIVGTQNLAVVPNSSIPVSVGSINANSNSAYYVENGKGTTPLINIDVQYDGFTKPLTAKAYVQPCETYHIKLAIADVNDDAYDSGVFLQNHSFSAKNIPELSVKFEHNHFPFGLEGCNDFEVIIKRGDYDLTKMNEIIYYDYELLGSATSGVDYDVVIPLTVEIPANSSSVSYNFSVLTDGITEGEEKLKFKISSGCTSFLEVIEIDVPIRDKYTYTIDDTLLCGTNEVTLNPNPSVSDDLTWEDSPTLSCLNCVSPSASNIKPTWYAYEATDQVSGCKSNDSVFVNYSEINSEFEFKEEDCYTIQDVLFTNLSQNATNYSWNFGDGGTSNEQNPRHTYGDWMDEKTKGSYNVTLLAKNTELKCESSTTKVLDIENVLLIPNVVTPNGDGKNDFFTIDGIVGECWTLTIFNRYGKLIYQQDNYQNEWSPIDISDGVYYYDLQNDIGDRIFKGYILIVR